MIFLTLMLVMQTSLDRDLPRGQIIADVKCAADSTQSYSLYLPSAYTPDRAWPVILAFDPGGRGRNGVERYQAAAEKYGYLVAGSNNSRNGSPETGKAVAAMSSDVLARFNINTRRVYTAGMSGGARVAFSVALSARSIAGVMASSAGYPDGQVRKSLPFPVFATAGTEDFNHLEMRELDRELKSPHHLEIFQGGHVWLSSDLAMMAVEWMEIQGMKSGLVRRDAAVIDQIFTKRNAAISPDRKDLTTLLALQSIAADFEGLKDVKALAARAAELDRDKSIRAAIKDARDEDDRETAMLRGVWELESRLGSGNDRPRVLADLKDRWRKLSEQSKKPEDTVDRRLARRVLAGLSAGTSTQDPEYLAIIREYRTGRGGRN
jgi:poly(3-hydroxybutyrate) depolymerase